MYFLTTKAIQDPESLEVIVRRMTILSPEDVRRLGKEYGVDTISVIICANMRAVRTATRHMMDGRS